MDGEILKTVSQIAGIGGVALGVFLLLFRDIIRKQIFPQLGKQHAFRLLSLLALLVWSVAVIGVGAWVWTETRTGAVSSATARTGIANTGEMKVDGNTAIQGTAEGN